MKYDFDEIIDRSNTNSVKYAKAQRLHPSLPEGLYPYVGGGYGFRLSCPCAGCHA